MATGPVPRRTFLKRAAIAGGAVAAAGAAAFGTRELFFGESPPPMQAPADVETRWPVKHVVYLMLENRSFNHMFGAFPGATDVTRVGVVDGREVPLTTAAEWLPGDLPHFRAAALNDVRDGRMDGFTIYDRGEFPYIDQAMSLHERDTVANWWRWAETLRPVRPPVLLGEQRVLPEPPVRDRGDVGRRVRQHRRREQPRRRPASRGRGGATRPRART